MFAGVKDMFNVSYTNKSLRRLALKVLAHRFKRDGQSANPWATSYTMHAYVYYPISVMRNDHYSPHRTLIIIRSGEKRAVFVIGLFTSTFHEHLDLDFSDPLCLEFPLSTPNCCLLDTMFLASNLKKGRRLKPSDISLLLAKSMARGDNIYYAYYAPWLEICEPAATQLSQDPDVFFMTPAADYSCTRVTMSDAESFMEHHLILFVLQPTMFSVPLGGYAQARKYLAEERLPPDHDDEGISPTSPLTLLPEYKEVFVDSLVRRGSALFEPPSKGFMAVPVYPLGTLRRFRLENNSGMALDVSGSYHAVYVTPNALCRTE